MFINISIDVFGYVWDFGDGMILVSDEEMVSYDYLVMGIFMVILGLIYDVSCVIIFLVDVII